MANFKQYISNLQTKYERRSGRVVNIAYDNETGRQTRASIAIGDSTIAIPLDLLTPNIAPGDFISLENRGTATAADWRIANVAGARPLSGILQFYDNTTVDETTYGPGDIVLGGTTAGQPNFYFKYKDGIWYRRIGTNVMGYDSAAGDSVWGPPSGVHWAMHPAENKLSVYNGENELRRFDGDTGYIYGWDGVGQPLGPGIRWGQIEELDTNGDPVLDSAGNPVLRYAWRMLGTNGVPIISALTGTQDDPDDAQWLIGHSDSDNYLRWSGSTLRMAGVFDGEMNFSNTGTININNNDILLSASGLYLDADNADYNYIKWISNTTSPSDVFSIGAYGRNGAIIVRGDEINDVLTLWMATKDYSSGTRLKITHNPAIPAIADQIVAYVGSGSQLTVASALVSVDVNMQLSSSDAGLYLGDTDIDGTWRFSRSASNLNVSYLTSGSWINRFTFIPKNNIITVASDGSGNYTTVTAAVTAINTAGDAASDNHYVISVATGTYTEDITLPDFVSLRGMGWKATTLSGTLTVGSGSHVEDITIYAPSPATVSLIATQATDTTYITNTYIVINTSVDDVVYAIQDTGGTDLRIYNSFIYARNPNAGTSAKSYIVKHENTAGDTEIQQCHLKNSCPHNGGCNLAWNASSASGSDIIILGASWSVFNDATPVAADNDNPNGQIKLDITYENDNHDHAMYTTSGSGIIDASLRKHITWLTPADSGFNTEVGANTRLSGTTSLAIENVGSGNGYIPFNWRIPYQMGSNAAKVTDATLYYWTGGSAAYIDNVQLRYSSLTGTSSSAFNYTTDLGSGSTGNASALVFSGSLNMTDAPYTLVVNHTGASETGTIRIYGVRVGWEAQ